MRFAADTAEKAVKAGSVCKDIDKIARDIIYSAGYEGCFGHGLGHSVGIEIHENPCFNTRCDAILRPGMILTNEPGIYIENEFGVRIEDMLYVTENGCQNLTKSDKKLIIIWYFYQINGFFSSILVKFEIIVSFLTIVCYNFLNTVIYRLTLGEINIVFQHFTHY